MPHNPLKLDRNRRMEFEADAEGKIRRIRIHGENGVREHDASGDIGELMLDGQPVSWVPDGTVLKTGANSYYYYFFNGKWYRITV